MTNAELERLARALVHKHIMIPHDFDTIDDVIRTAVQTTVIDTYLVMTGALLVEDFEE
jgi:hypothetical protein